MIKVKSSLTGHILQATYDWFLDNNFRDILIVAHTKLANDLPEITLKYAKEDHTIIFNIHPRCVGNFYISAEYVSFNASIDGVMAHIKLPLYSVLGVVTPIDADSNAFFEMPLIDRYINSDIICEKLEGKINSGKVDEKPELTTVDNVTKVNFKKNSDLTVDKSVMRDPSGNLDHLIVNVAIDKLIKYANSGDNNNTTDGNTKSIVSTAITTIERLKQNAPELIIDWCERVIKCPSDEYLNDNITKLLLELFSYPVLNKEKVASEPTVDSDNSQTGSLHSDVTKMVEDFNNSPNSQVIINKPSRPTGPPKLMVIKGGKK